MDDLKQIRRIVSIAIYGLVSVVVALIIVRIFLLVIGANTSSPAVSFIYNASDTFVGMFKGIYPNIVVNSGQFIIEIYSIIALFFYVSVAFLVSKSINSVVEADIIQIIINLIDTGFKFLEFILILRFIFKLTGASVASQFLVVLYQVSNIIYEPFKGILPGFTIPSINAVFETSTIIAIIIIIVFDVVSEGIIAHLRREWEAEKSSKPIQPQRQVTQVIHTHETTPVQQTPVQQTPAPAAPNITINFPQQQQQQAPTQYIDRRTVQVVSPNTPLQSSNHPTYPYFGANDLERQRPQQNYQLQGQGYYPQPHGEPSASRNANPSSANS